MKDLADERVTYFEYADGRKETFTDNWHKADNPKGPSPERFVGKTVFKLSSKPTGRKLVGKQTTLPEPTPLRQPQPVPQQQLQQAEPEAPQPLFKQPTKGLKEQSTEDTFRLRLQQTSSGTLDDFRKKDPATGQPYTHDLWLDFPSCWVRVHYEQRTTLFVLEDPHFEEVPFWHADVWRKAGATLISSPFVGATCFEKADLQLVECEPEAPEYVARRPRGLKQPGEPTLTERLEHELTHLPFKPWCEVCVRAKSKQAKSRRLSLKQPVLQMDFSFLGDKPGEEQITISNVVDVLSGMALSVVIPTKAHLTHRLSCDALCLRPVELLACCNVTLSPRHCNFSDR